MGENNSTYVSAEILPKSTGGLERPAEIHNAMAAMSTVLLLPLELVASSYLRGLSLVETLIRAVLGLCNMLREGVFYVRVWPWPRLV